MESSCMSYNGKSAIYERRARYSDGRGTDKSALERGLNYKAKRMVSQRAADGSTRSATFFRR